MTREEAIKEPVFPIQEEYRLTLLHRMIDINTGQKIDIEEPLVVRVLADEFVRMHESYKMTVINRMFDDMKHEMLKQLEIGGR